MLGGALTGLIVAWVLAQFGFDKMFIDAAKQLGYVITIDTYYVLLIIIGAIGGAIRKDD